MDKFSVTICCLAQHNINFYALAYPFFPFTGGHVILQPLEDQV